MRLGDDGCRQRRRTIPGRTPELFEPFRRGRDCEASVHRGLARAYIVDGSSRPMEERCGALGRGRGHRVTVTLQNRHRSAVTTRWRVASKLEL